MVKHFNQVLPISPLRLTIYITKKCNLSCDFCYVKHNLNTPEPNSLNFDEWKKVIDKIPRTTVIDFCGGEIFLAKDMMRILDYMTQKKRLVSIITNGTTVNEKMADFFIDKKITYYMTSIDGMWETHDRIRGKQGVFKQSDKMFKYLHEEKKKRKKKFPLTCLKTVITPENAHEILDLLKYSEHEAKVDHVQLSLIHEHKFKAGYDTFDNISTLDELKGNTFSYEENDKEKIKKALRDIFEYRKTSKIFIGLSPTFGSEQEILDYVDDHLAFGVKKCDKQWSEFFLHYDGQIAPCISNNWGNIRDFNYDISQVLRSERARSFNKALEARMPFFPECEGCCRTIHTKKG
tara:strand:- start:52009 stop:53052 length:1044 start_codon:yes stop_codon:yes gene_type:complete